MLKETIRKLEQEVEKLRNNLAEMAQSAEQAKQAQAQQMNRARLLNKELEEVMKDRAAAKGSTIFIDFLLVKSNMTISLMKISIHN